MRILSFSLSLVVCSLVMTGTVFSQTMSNTTTTITVSNTCFNRTVASGSYTLDLQYADPENGLMIVSGLSTTVTSNGSTLTVSAPSGNFPIPIAGSGAAYFALKDCDNGILKLTSGGNINSLIWYHDDNGNLTFNCIALPIYFSNFTGSRSGSTVNLSWQTQLEQNTTVIEVYRSSTGAANSYYKIGQKTAAGNSSGILNYTFADNAPAAQNYYQLKMLNSQGSPAIFSTIVTVACSTCSYTPPTAVNCNYTINGPDHVCSIQTPTAYTLSTAVPNFNTITWSVDQPTYAHVNTYPAFDRGHVTLLKKNNAGAVTLRATLSGCSNVITKVIAMGTPDPVVTTELMCPYLNANMSNTPGATSYIWQWTDVFTNVTTNYPGWGFNNQFMLQNGDEYFINASYTNACGTSNVIQLSGWWCDPGGGWDPPGGDGLVALSPNPSTGVVSVGLPGSGAVRSGVVKSSAVGSGVAGSPARSVPKIYRVKVLDLRGVLQKEFSYPGGVGRPSLDLSGLSNGIYIVQVYDSKRWVAGKIVVAK